MQHMEITTPTKICGETEKIFFSSTAISYSLYLTIISLHLRKNVFYYHSPQ